MEAAIAQLIRKIDSNVAQLTDRLDTLTQQLSDKIPPVEKQVAEIAAEVKDNLAASRHWMQRFWLSKPARKMQLTTSPSWFQRWRTQG